MASQIFFKDKPIIGLDISLTGLKVMSLDAKRWQVQGYGSIDLDPLKMQNVFDNSDKEESYLSSNITKLLRESLEGSLASNHVVVGIPTSKTFSRTFSLPLKQEKNIDSAVEVEVAQYIPIPISALYVDYEIIDRDKKEVYVIMSAVPKLLVDNILKASQDAGLRPIMVEPSINAVYRLLEGTEDARLTTLVIDIGQAYTDIAVVDRHAPRVTGGLAIGGNTFTLEIAKKMNVSLDRAHQLKVLHGLSLSPNQEKISHALKNSLEKTTNEVRKVIRYYNERVSGSVKIEQVLVVGAGSNVPGIGEYFTNELIMPARVANPWQQLNFGKLKQPSKQFRPRYLAVAGLAHVSKNEVWK